MKSAMVRHRAQPTVFAVKQDIETQDDLRLASLEIEGLAGTSPQPLATGSIAVPSEIVDLARSQGADVANLMVAAVRPDDVPNLLRRLGMVSHFVLEGTTGPRIFETQQTQFELGAGASGLASKSAGRSRQKNEYLSHNFHKYKAKFFPRMARALTNFVSPVGNVADPFTGSGTLNVEASLMGIDSFGVDIDPLSVLIAQSKTKALRTDIEVFEKAYIHLVESLTETSQFKFFDDEYAQPLAYSDALTVSRLPEFIGRKVDVPVRAAIEADIERVQRVINAYTDETGRQFLKLALSHAIATKISLRWMGTGDPRFAMSIAKRDLVRIMTSHMLKIVTAMRQRDVLIADSGTTALDLGEPTITQGDVRRLDWQAESISGIVTSPPYLPAASGRETYLRSRACSLTALGLMTESEILERESNMVGTICRSAPARSKGLPPSVSELVEWMAPQRARAPKALPTAAYFLDIAAALREMARVLKPGGQVAMVLSKQHVFYELGSRQVVKTLDMPDVVSQLIDDPENAIPLHHDRTVTIQLPKMDYAARPASTGEYSEAIIIAHRA